jgi:dihydrolipoamide dehydrogenase
MPFGGRILSSREAIELDHVPSSVGVIGGGYIGVEIGKMLRKAGASVTIMEAAPGILTLVDPEISAIALKRLGVMGVEVMTNIKPEKVEANENSVAVTINGQTRNFDYLLIAVGHAPTTENLQLEAAGVQLDERGFVRIDKQCKTTVHNIYAVGDVTGGMMLAHKAFAQGKVAAEAIAGQPSEFSPACIPAVIFSEPEIGTVGLSEDEARKQYGEDGIKVGVFPFAALGKALAENATEGFVKIIADKEGVIIGVHAVGPGVSDYIAEASLAIEMGAKAEDLALTIHPHPTLSESISEAAEALLHRSIHLYQGKK